MGLKSLEPIAQAVIVPERLSGMLGGRPDTAEYFLNAYHDMYLGVISQGDVEMVGFFCKQVHWP